MPELGLGLADTNREVRLGWRLTERVAAGVAFELGVEGTRREWSDGEASPRHGVGIGVGWRLAGTARASPCASNATSMAALPAAPFDACHQAPGQVSSQSLVRFQTNDYSVPFAYGYDQVWVRGYVEQVVIGCGTEIIARHRRSYEGEDTVFDPLHYLPLIERKPGALDQAAPLAGWELPDAFATFRRLMEARSGRAGRREYVQVLRLLETFGLDDLHAAVKHALRLGAIGFDAGFDNTFSPGGKRMGLGHGWNTNEWEQE